MRSRRLTVYVSRGSQKMIQPVGKPPEVPISFEDQLKG